MTNNKFIGFEQWLEAKYIGQNEDGGVPITKDNVETMFDRYLEELDNQEIMDLANLYGQAMYLASARRAVEIIKTN